MKPIMACGPEDPVARTQIGAAGLRPLLSILVPAYRYAAGVLRILDALASGENRDFEVRIYDDSPDAAVGSRVKHWAALHPDVAVIYHRNAPALGAAKNWNSLIGDALGDHCVLMHHDEFPLGAYVDLLTKLLRQWKPDVILCDCVLVHPGGWWRRHVPGWLREWVVRHRPRYLLRRNVIGPTAALVVRRELFPSFDERLTWLIDVDMYLRLLHGQPKLLVARDVRIGSVLNRGDSITAGLKGRISAIERGERRYLAARGADQTTWLRGRDAKGVVSRLAEATAWAGMRLTTRGLSRLVSNPVIDSEVRDMQRRSRGELKA